MIQECTANLVCQVFRTVEINGFEMFFGNIVDAYGNETCLTNGKLDPLKLNPLIMCVSDYLSLNQKVGSVFHSGKSVVIDAKPTESEHLK
jgi:flavin reductase (DIM6/NTAB) family NADH-FMN oxidoreductase RutF